MKKEKDERKKNDKKRNERMRERHFQQRRAEDLQPHPEHNGRKVSRG